MVVWPISVSEMDCEPTSETANSSSAANDFCHGQFDEESIHKNIFDIKEDLGIKKIESLVILRKKMIKNNIQQMDSEFYTLRRQCESLVKGLLEKRNEFKHCVFWFITDNSVQDYNFCKNYIRNKGVDVRIRHSRLLTKDGDVLAKLLHEYLSSRTNTIEADVSVLRSIIDTNETKPDGSQQSDPAESGATVVGSTTAASAVDPAKQSLLKKIYKYIQASYKSAAK